MTSSGQHSWPLPLALRAIQAEGRGAALLLNAAESSADLLAGLLAANDKPRSASGSPEVELRTYGVGAQILRPYIGEETHWVLAHHSIFQGYYYWHHVGKDRNERERKPDRRSR